MWSDSDTAEYNGAEAQYEIFKVLVDKSAVTSATPGSNTVYDVNGEIAASKKFKGSLDGYSVIAKGASSFITNLCSLLSS